MPASPRFSRAPRFLVGVLAICSLGALVYSNSLDAAFVYDDTRSITGNPRIRVEHLGWRELYEAAFESPLPRPVANLSFALNHYIGEYEVAGYHVVNVAIHLVNGVLVYLLALFLFAHSAHPRPSREWAALLAALVFTAHPVQSQSVTYVVQRMSSLAVMFYLGALLLYLRGRSSPRGWRRWASWAGAGAAWILALGSKEIAAVLPVTIWLCEWYFFQDLSRTWLRRNLKIGCVVLALLATLAFFYLGEHPSNGF